MTGTNDDLNALKQEWAAAAAEPIPDGVEAPEIPGRLREAVPIPIPSQARQFAERMAAHCIHPDRQETQRRNLLAVMVLRDYLQFQGYLPDLEASDCWNPILGRQGDIADLVVSQVGRFECCAIAPEVESCAVPMEGQFNRVGYVVVELDAEERWGWLVGFLPGQDSETPVERLNRSELEPMDKLGEHLQRLWLLWQIVQQSAEPWDAHLRAEMVAILERSYRRYRPAQRPMRVATELAEQWGAELNLDTSPALASAGSREGERLTNQKLSHFVRDVFDQLEDALEAEDGR